MNKRTSALGVILGFLSRPCCVLPLVFSVFGLSSTGMVLFLNEFRTVLVFIAITFLAISGYYNFRVRGGIFNKAVFLFSVLVTLSFLAIPYLGVSIYSLIN